MVITAQEILNSLFNPEDKKRGVFAGQKLDVECGKFASIEETLRQHNAQDRGIFFVVNFGGQDDEAITRINAQFVESDELSFEEQEKQICKTYRCKRGRVLLQWRWQGQAAWYSCSSRWC